jgi:hypothetical protein
MATLHFSGEQREYFEMFRRIHPVIPDQRAALDPESSGYLSTSLDDA